MKRLLLVLSSLLLAAPAWAFDEDDEREQTGWNFGFDAMSVDRRPAGFSGAANAWTVRGECRLLYLQIDGERTQFDQRNHSSGFLRLILPFGAGWTLKPGVGYASTDLYADPSRGLAFGTTAEWRIHPAFRLSGFYEQDPQSALQLWDAGVDLWLDGFLLRASYRSFQRPTDTFGGPSLGIGLRFQ